MTGGNEWLHFIGGRGGPAVRLKEIRERRGLTQAQLAEKVGVTREYITMLETGARRNPAIEILVRLAKALNVEVGRLLR